MLEHLLRDRIEAADGNHVLCKGLARVGIDNRGRENAASLCQSGHRADPGDSGPQARTLPIDKKECLVLLKRSAHRQTVLIAPEFRFWTRRRKVISSIQIFIAKELEECSMKIVTARFGVHHYGAAVRPPIFWRIRVDIEPEFRDAVNNRIKGYLSRLGRQNADTVIEIFVGSRPAAIDA